MFKIIVIIFSLATQQPLAISFSLEQYDAKTCASLMLHATKEVAKEFEDQQIRSETRCVPVEIADKWRAAMDKLKQPTDKIYDL